jgi:anti-anti-sigma regulatory factor
MPLVGTLDTTRLQTAQQCALHTMERTATVYAVLDITGVPLVDTQVAQGLLNIIRAARLLGTEVVVVGIRAEVAQAVASLGIELNEVGHAVPCRKGLPTRSLVADAGLSLLGGVQWIKAQPRRLPSWSSMTTATSLLCWRA